MLTGLSYIPAACLPNFEFLIDFADGDAHAELFELFDMLGCIVFVFDFRYS